MLHILQYDCIRASLEHKHFQKCFESLRYGMRDQVVFALRSGRETVWRISSDVFRPLYPFLSNRVSRRKWLVVLVRCCLWLWHGCQSLRRVVIPFRKNEDTAFFFVNQELLQHRVRDFSSFREIAMQQVVHVRRHHGNDSWLVISKCEQSRQNLVQWEFELFTRVLQTKPQSSSCIFRTVDGNTWG